MSQGILRLRMEMEFLTALQLKVTFKRQALIRGNWGCF